MSRSHLRGNLPFIVLLCALLLCSCQQEVKLPPLADDAVILAFGDSLTYGTGANRNESYPAILAALTGRQVINAGVPGEVTDEGRKRLPPLLDSTRPALLLLCHGGNDFLRRLDQTQVKKNLRVMVQSARERGISVVLIAVPTLGFGLQIPTLYQELAAEEKIPLEGSALEKILGNAALKSDPIHPNADGYQELATAVERLLRRCQAL